MSLFASYVVAVAGAVVGLLLVILATVDPRGFAALRSAGAELFGPVARGTASVGGGIGSLGDTIGAYIQAGTQNRALRAQLEASRNRLLQAQALAQENRELKALLRIEENSDAPVLVTRLLGSTASSARRLATLDAGRNRGVTTGMPVRAAEGLIGRTLEVGPTLARVLLITDAENVVPVRRARDGLPALSIGRSDGQVDIRALNLGAAQLRRGDMFVTSGTGGLYRPNIPVAIVRTVEGDGAIARPLAHPARVSAVLVERAFRDSDAAKQLPPVEGARRDEDE